ncbi:MAG: ATP-binding protein [Spirochaetes bacterium]|nr:ATP-binding protein [Spirochaetota bacterium]
MYIERDISLKLKELERQYKVVSLTGPRQAGKTTLVKKVFPEKEYLSLENPDNLEFALTDPRGFLSQSNKDMIIDEAQKAPKLFSYIQGIVDNSSETGKFILTGSQNFLLLEKITQSLAGRTAILKLLPFNQNELGLNKRSVMLEKIIVSGMYPPVYDRQVNPSEWYSNYIMTYIERDVRSILNIGNLNTFQRFLKLTAGRSGQILNYSSLANDCGITHNTARSWLSILEASYIVTLMPPYYKNFNKRIVKAPKLYFLDSGLLCHLLNITNEDIYNTHPLKGAIFETYVYSELVKTIFNRGRIAELYYWRDKTGHEVDFIVPNKDGEISIEVKAGKTITSDYFKGINYWQSLTGRKNSFIIYAGNDEQKRSQCHILPWNNISKIPGN